MITIGNVKTYKPEDGVITIKVDRSSPLGNPFFMYSESERDMVCNKYERYFYRRLHNQNTTDRFKKELDRIYTLCFENDVVLLCWCYPERCHAETIKKYLEERLRREK